MRGQSDRGVVLILVAVAMVAILIVAAMAIDLGSKRSDRRSDQLVADLASLAAGSFLAGNGSTTVISNAYLACKGALTSTQMNVPDFSPTQDPDTTCGVFPVDAGAGCSSTTVPADATFSDSRYTLTIRYPIPDSELTDGRFSGGTGANDGTDQCERMRVTFGRTTDTNFAGVIGVDEQSTKASSVIRATTSQLGQGVAALLLLERLGCASLQNSGQGELVVRAPTASNPGVIQADSAGQVAPCTTNSNAGGYVVYGTQLPSAAGGGPSIVASTSSDGTPGIIGMYSLGLVPAGRGGAVFPGGLSVAPVRASISSRQPVDDKYNGVSSQITSLHSTAYARTGWNAATAAANGYEVVTGAAQCGGNIPAPTLDAANVFVDCGTFGLGNGDTLIFPNAVNFVSRGAVSIGNNAVLSLPTVRSFFVRGNGSSALDVQGKLLLNSGEAVLAGPDAYVNGVPCSARRGPGDGGTTTNWTQMVALNGEVHITGQARMCQTSLYMGSSAANYVRQTVTAPGVAPESYPSLAQCAPELPCPKDSVDTDWPFRVTGGGSATDWSAPNQLSTQPDATDFATYPLEDLALWSETSSINVEMKGQAGSLSQGVFFLPNGSATFQGQGTQPIELNAQYLIRRLNISGQGSMTLDPNPADSVITPIPGAVGVIR